MDNFNPETWRARTEVDFDENICVWQPTDALDEKTIQEYVDFAMNEHGYSVEQGDTVNLPLEAFFILKFFSKHIPSPGNLTLERI